MRHEGMKHVKKDHARVSVAEKFMDPEEVRTALAGVDISSLTQALTTLRNQLTIGSNETAPSPQDERLLLAKNWLNASPGAREVFSIMDRIPQPSPNVMSLCLAVLSALLGLFSLHFIYHPLGASIIKNLMSPSRIRQLNINLTSASSDLLMSTLKVFNAISTYAGNTYQRSVMDSFSWGQKSLHKLFFLRRKGKGANEADPISKPDVRTLYIWLILSFLSTSTPTSIKLSLLEQHRDVFLLIFKGISQDPYLVARRILEVCWEGIWNDPKIRRTLKIGLFSEQTINHILKLYARDTPENGIAEHVPADVVHHFMLALTTKPGVGICFRDRGWYPRESVLEDGIMKNVDMDGDEEESSNPQGGKINNKILANAIKGLKVNEDARQQELVFRILEACPELVAGFWGALNLTLEPRLSSRWITNIAIFGTIVSLPIPTHTFLLPHSTQYNPSPPPLSSALSNIFPSVMTKNHLTKGLQSPSKLVQHCTALALSKCLTKLQRVLTVFQDAGQQLEEEDENGQWSKRRRELEVEVEKRIPDFMVIVAMAQQKPQDVRGDQQNVKTTLLAESAVRLLWLYHKMFPRLIAEVRFDVGKVLLSITDQTPSTLSDDDTTKLEKGLLTQEGRSVMDILRQLHIIRLLKESEQFVWSSKSGSSSHSYLHVILMLYTKTPHPAVRAATSDLLSHLLSSSVLFSHDPTELVLWLDALPHTQRLPHATGPDGSALTDESTSVLDFLDDCIQRCTKTPYRYLEEGIAFFSETSSEHSAREDALMTQADPSKGLSPLLMTLFEQLRAKSIANLISPSDVLAIVTFIRQLIQSISRKQSDLQPARKSHARLEEICVLHNIVSNAPIIKDAVKRECDLLSHFLNSIENPTILHPGTSGSAVQQFLEAVENLPTPSSERSGLCSACELIDWMRLVHPALHPNDIERLMLTVLRLSPLAVKDFLSQVDPRQGHLWHSIRNLEILKKLVPFELAYLHTDPAQIAEDSVKDSLVSLFFSDAGWSQFVEHKLSIIMQRLDGIMKRDKRVEFYPEISLLTSILAESRSQQPKHNMEVLKRFIFSQSRPITELCCSPNILHNNLEAVTSLVKVGLNPKSGSDKTLALEYCNYWVAHSKGVIDIRSYAFAAPWIAYMEFLDVVHFLDVSVSAAQGGYSLSGTDKNLVACILDSLSQFKITPTLLEELQRRSRGLLDLRPYVDECSTLDALLLLMVEAGLPLGHDSLSLSMAPASTVSDVSLVAQERWKICVNRSSIYFDLTTEFLRSETWTENTARIVSAALYQSRAARRTFSEWLTRGKQHDRYPLGIVAIALHAFLDVTSFEGEGTVSQLPDPWFLALARHLFTGQESCQALTLYASCIRILFKSAPSQRVRYAGLLMGGVRSTTKNSINLDLLLLIRDLHQIDMACVSALFTEFSDKVLEWIPSRLSENLQSDDDSLLIEKLIAAISRMETKAYLVEPVLKAAVQNCFPIPGIIRSIIQLVSSISLQPETVNRVLQSVVQHPQLYRSTDGSLFTREPIIKLLHTLFHLHPTNTCQPSHVTPLIRLYGGTLSLSDKLLLSVFHLYEKQRKESIASIFHNWYSPGSGSPSQGVFAAITNLDPSKVFRTYTTFPTRRRLNATFSEAEDTGTDNDCYDPVFLMLLVGQLLAEGKQLSNIDWVQLFRTNAVSVIICGLTSRDGDFRNLAVSILAGVFRGIQDTDFLEKEQVIYIMDMLRDILPTSTTISSTPPPRLPMQPVLLLAHALRSTFYPSSFLYPIVSRFLLQRPELDVTDVPMLYSMLYSSSDNGDWIRERTWIIRFLTDSMREGGPSDWAILKRRHTWDRLATMWQATRMDERSFRKGILEFLANISANPYAITSLVLRSGILSWIELQLQAQTVNETENLAFVKILENILVTANGDRVHKAMCGEFCPSISRCLSIILHGFKQFDDSGSLELLVMISRVILRMASQDSPDTVMLSEILVRAVFVLRSIEPSITWESARPSAILSEVLPKPPHYARGLFEHSVVDSMEAWAKCVRLLWSATMCLGRWQGDREIWDALSCRLIVVRASDVNNVGNEGEGDVAEWGRRQVVECLLRLERD